jgi:hypothetical protein
MLSKASENPPADWPRILNFIRFKVKRPLPSSPVPFAARSATFGQIFGQVRWDRSLQNDRGVSRGKNTSM